MRRKTLLLIFFSLLGLTACNTYVKQVPTGTPLSLNNVYTNPSYNYDTLVNVLLLPINNPLSQEGVQDNSELIALAILRNFKQFHYFNIQFATEDKLRKQSVIDLQKSEINRTLMGELGQEYNAQAILQISVTDMEIYPPMRLALQAILVDASTGERIWQTSQVFDASNADVYNGMRYWWNTHVAGANPFNRFDFDRLRPNTFFDYVFYTIANSYGSSRVDNIKSIAQEYEKEKKRSNI